MTCTFVNRRSGRITVVKDARPNDPQDFDFTAGGGLSPSTFTLDDDGNESNGVASTRAYTSVPPGSGYSVAETVPSGWTQASATCSDGSPITNIDVSAGENVTCTFTNDKQATLVVIKDAQPDDPQDFSFTTGGGLSPTSFQLDDDGDDSNALASSRTFTNLTPGSGYSVSEAPQPGWDGTATCSDGSPPSNVTLDVGEVVTCTFTNRRRGSITLNLDTQPDDPQDFSFTTTGGLSPSSFDLDDDGDTGNALSNTISFTDVPATHYSIALTPVSGWIQEEGTCTNGSQVSDIDVAPGQHVTCTIVTSRRGKIVVKKDARPNQGTDFSFTAGGGLSPSSFQLDDDGDEANTLRSTREFMVDPGAGYSVAEGSVPPGWRLDSATCSDGSPISNISVAAGETVTCTFVNVADAVRATEGRDSNADSARARVPLVHLGKPDARSTARLPVLQPARAGVHGAHPGHPGGERRSGEHDRIGDARRPAGGARRARRLRRVDNRFGDRCSLQGGHVALRNRQRGRRRGLRGRAARAVDAADHRPRGRRRRREPWSTHPSRRR